MDRHFLFGAPVVPAKPVANGQRDVFVLGAYPSALYASWWGPDSSLLVRAVAVDNEPEPFWTGDDQAVRISAWADKIGFRREWGSADPCGRSNGSSGIWVSERVLQPLGVHRSSAWITDCLDTYFESANATKVLDTERIRNIVQFLGIPERRQSPHPSESQIVSEATKNHSNRLLKEFNLAEPKLLVTLGNAALRVVLSVSQKHTGCLNRLSVKDYGTLQSVTFAGRNVDWYPLAHPAAPIRYQAAHEDWMKLQRDSF